MGAPTNLTTAAKCGRCAGTGLVQVTLKCHVCNGVGMVRRFNGVDDTDIVDVATKQGLATTPASILFFTWIREDGLEEALRKAKKHSLFPEEPK